MKRWYLPISLHGIITQNIIIFTILRTLHLTNWKSIAAFENINNYAQYTLLSSEGVTLCPYVVLFHRLNDVASSYTVG
jgi:hypothetical protein